MNTTSGYQSPEAGSTAYVVRHRFLDTTVGRWLRRDDLGYADSTSLYMNVRANPLTRNDPMGMLSSHASAFEFEVQCASCEAKPHNGPADGITLTWVGTSVHGTCSARLGMNPVIVEAPPYQFPVSRFRLLGGCEKATACTFGGYVLVQTALASGTITSTINGTIYTLPFPSAGLTYTLADTEIPCGEGRKYTVLAKNNNGSVIGHAELQLKCQNCNGGWVDLDPDPDY